MEDEPGQERGLFTFYVSRFTHELHFTIAFCRGLMSYVGELSGHDDPIPGRGYDPPFHGTDVDSETEGTRR